MQLESAVAARLLGPRIMTYLDARNPVLHKNPL